MALMKRSSEVFLPMSRENSRNRGLKEAAWLDDAFLIFVGPAQYLAQTAPGSMKSIRIFAVEDDALMQKSLNAIGASDAKLQAFIAGHPGNPGLWVQL